MAVLSFTNCVTDVTIIILCPPFPSLPPSLLSAKHQEPERRDRKAVRLTSPFTCRMTYNLLPDESVLLVACYSRHREDAPMKLEWQSVVERQFADADYYLTKE